MDKVNEYITEEYDTFDIISLKFYGQESYSNKIMEANPNLIKTIVFDRGVKLLIPEIEVKNDSTLPPWKK